MSATERPARLSSRRVVGRALLVGLALGGALLAGGLWLSDQRAARAAHPVLEGTLPVAGLEAPLDVVRDRRGVPHVRAASEPDAWFALGFVHAQDRLAQMLWLRQLAQGRSAERLGPEGLVTDRWVRTLDLAGAARRESETLSGRPERLLRAYAAGVNARLARLRAEAGGERPAGSGTAPEPWTPADSLALLKLHALGLEDTSRESLVLAALLRRLGPREARPFFPSQVGFEALPPPGPTVAGHPVAGAAAGESAPAAVLRERLGMRGADVGSTALVVEGGWTRRGAPLLAADTHFEPRQPAPLYEAHLRGGDLEVAGATLPGIPLFWIGFTPRVAWASTAARAVVMDLAIETLHPEDPDLYRDGSRWRPLETRREQIRVAGAPDETLEVRSTRRGPLVHEQLPGALQPLSLKWAALQGGDGLAAYLSLPHAPHATALRRALAGHHAPVVAVIYADADGGGLQLAGYVPLRELPSGLVPVPARNPAYDWSARIPFAALPRLRLGREAPLVVAADGLLPPARISGVEYLWRSGERQRHIETRLERARRSGPLELTHLVALQRDVGSAGPELVEVALRLAGPTSALGREARQIASLLEAWDGRAAAESVGASAYAVFELRLLRALLEPVLGEELLARYLGLSRMRPLALLVEILRRAEEEGGEAAERAASRVRRSLRNAWIHLSVELGANRAGWRWGRLHPLRFSPLLPGKGSRDGFGPFAYGGDSSSVRVGAYQPLEPFDTALVSSYRFAADAGDLDQALTALAPGQSEHAGHVHAGDGLERWLRGRPSLLSISDPVIEDTQVRRLGLVPAD